MTTRNLWFIVVGVAILAALLITKMFQPSGVVIPYDAASYFEVRKLFFAAGVLAVLGFMLILSIAVYMSLSQSNPAISAGKDIFDSMVKVVPPIITLVLGYYFGQQSAVKTITDPATIQVNKEANRDQKLGTDTKTLPNTIPASKDTKVSTPPTPTDPTPGSPSNPVSDVKKP